MDDNKRIKFTTTLSEKCLKQLDTIGYKIEKKNKNDVIEYLVEKEIKDNAMDKKRSSE